MAESTAVAVVDVPASGPSDFNSSIDAAFAAIPAVVAPSTEVVPAEPAAVEPSADFPSLEPITAPDSTSADGKVLTFGAAKGKRLLEAAAFVKALHEILPGGTVEDFATAIGKANAADLLIVSYLAAPTQDAVTSNQSLDLVLDTFLQQNNPKAFGMMISRAIGKLPNVDIEGFNFLQRHFNARLIEGLKDRARQTVDEKAREQTVFLIQRLQMALTGGRFEKADEILKGATVDPAVQERQELDRRRQEVEAREAAERNKNKLQWDQWIDSEEDRGWQEEVTAVLNSVRARYDERTLQSIKDDLVQAIRVAENARPEWKERRDGLRTEADLLRSSESIAALSAYRRSIAKQSLAGSARGILDRWGNAVVQQATAANDKARTGVTNELPATGIAPSAANGIDAKAAIMKSAKTFEEAFKDW